MATFSDGGRFRYGVTGRVTRLDLSPLASAGDKPGDLSPLVTNPVTSPGDKRKGAKPTGLAP